QLGTEQGEALVALARHRPLGSDGCGQDRCSGGWKVLLPTSVRLAEDAGDCVVREAVRPRPQRALPPAPLEVVPDVLAKLREGVLGVVTDEAAGDVATDVGLEALDDLRRGLVPFTSLEEGPGPCLELAPVCG